MGQLFCTMESDCKCINVYTCRIGFSASHQMHNCPSEISYSLLYLKSNQNPLWHRRLISKRHQIKTLDVFGGIAVTRRQSYIGHVFRWTFMDCRSSWTCETRACETWIWKISLLQNNLCILQGPRNYAQDKHSDLADFYFVSTDVILQRFVCKMKLFVRSCLI